MNEKRLKFTLESDRQYIGIFDEGYALTGFEVCNLLNSLYQQCEALQDENEQLKEKLQSVTMLKDDYEELIESFEKKYGKNIEDVIDDERSRIEN